MFTKKIEVGKIVKTVTDWDAVVAAIFWVMIGLAIIGWLAS